MPALASVLELLARLHDLATRVGAATAALFVGAIALLYCSEVVTRYFLHAPTSWTAAVAVYLMLGTVVLMMPYLVMAEDHVSISMGNHLSPRAARRLTVAILAMCVVVCGISTFISCEETLRAFHRGVRTTDTLFVPKWWLLAPIVYGLGSSTIHFARRLVTCLHASGNARGTEASVA